MAAVSSAPPAWQRERRKFFPSFSRFRRPLTDAGFMACLVLLFVLWAMTPASAQSFRFNLRADPDVIPANGISTASILVQVQNTGGVAISAAPTVRFITTDGTIESQVQLSGGVARVLLRSSTTPGTALVTAFIGNAREQIPVEFSDGSTSFARFLELSGSYVAYGAETGVITASGKCVFDYGETHIESDVRLDVDLDRDRVWAEGNGGGVLIRQGKGSHAHELRGNRLFYDLQRRRGVMHRSDTAPGLARQEFMGSELSPLPVSESTESPDANAPHGKELPPAEVARETKEDHDAAAAETTTQAPEPAIDPSSRPTEVTPPEATEPQVTPPTEEAPTIEPLAADGDAAAQPETLAAPPQPGAGGAGVVLPSPTEPLIQAGTVPRSGVVLSPRSQRAAITVVQTGDITSLPTARLYNIETPGSLGGSPDTLASPTAFGGSLHEPESKPSSGEPQVPPSVPAYNSIDEATKPSGQIFEPLPPDTDFSKGYAIAARHLRVFPHDRIQFEKATLFLNGGKIFSMPRYVVPLNQAFNPGQDILDFNSTSGIALNVPFTYMATQHGQGTVFVQHAPNNGFAAEKPGFALAVTQEYWLSPNSSGRVLVDQLGHGNWNLNLQHKLQLTPTTNASFSLDMPEHRDAYARASLLKDFSSMQVGIEGFYSQPRGGLNDFQGQVYARLRPRNIGKRGWAYTVSANASSWRRYPELVQVTTSTGSGGGIGLPGRGGTVTSIQTQYRAAYGETLDFSLQAPVFRLWKGGSINTTMRLTGFNQSIGRRGIAPGLTVGMAQNFGHLGSLQLNYGYDKSGGLFTTSNLTHLVSTSLLLTPTRRLAASAFITKSLSDHSFYSSTTLDYALATKWRIGLFSDYSTFAGSDDFTDYGWTLGRTIGQREITLNWSAQRGRIYFELGGFRL